MSRAPLLTASGVARRFGSATALEPTDLEVWEGEAIALVGPNGAGKSTLLALLAGRCPRPPVCARFGMRRLLV